MSFDDQFSQLAQQYAQFRPQSPPELANFFASITPAHSLALDCGTGSGQAARALAEHYTTVIACDPSRAQIANALPHGRVHYLVAQAERLPAKSNVFDLITVAQAVHWFDLDAFYGEARRLLKPGGGILAVWTYYLFESEAEIDAVIAHYNDEVLGPYWSPRLKAVREKYRTLPFPFEELAAPDIAMQTDWDLAQVTGYLASWSATSPYQEKLGRHPLNEVYERLLAAWGDPAEKKSIRWPLFIRVGKMA